MKCLFVVGIVLTFCVMSISAQGKKSELLWKSGEILEQRLNTKSYEKVYKITLDGKDEEKSLWVTESSQWMMFKTDDITYFLDREVNFFWDKSLKLKKGMKVDYAIDDEIMYLRNAKGKKFKYKIGNTFPN